MRLESLKFFISAVALSSALIAATLAEPAAAQRSGVNYPSSASSGGPQIDFNIFTQTLDGTLIVDSNPSLTSGLFQGAASYSYRDNQRLVLQFAEDRFITIPSLDLLTVDKGNFVEFTFFSPNPYEVYVNRPVRDESGYILGRETVLERIQAPGIIKNFYVFGYRPIPIDPVQGPLPGTNPAYEVVNLDDNTRSQLVNSLEFIVNNVKDLDFYQVNSEETLQLNRVDITLGIDTTRIIDNSSGGTASVPEPGTTAASFIAGAMGLVTMRKRKLQ